MKSGYRYRGTSRRSEEHEFHREGISIDSAVYRAF